MSATPPPRALHGPTPEERLRTDPYDLAALAERMLEAADRDHRGKARADLALLRRLRGELRVRALLEPALADGGPGVARSGRCFYLGEAPPSPVFASDLDDAVSACAAHLGEPAPVILVHRHDGAEGVHLAHREFPGFSVVSVSSRSPRFPDGLRRTLFHETAHCFLRCGCDLLDEGLAQAFADGHSGVAGAPAPAAAPERTLRELLLAAEVPHDRWGLVRRQGARLVDAVLAASGAKGLKRLFSEIEAEPERSRWIARVEEALGRPLDLLEAPAARVRADLPGLRRAIARAWAAQDPTPLAGAASALEAAGDRSAEALDCLACARAAEAGIALSQGAAVPPERMAALDALLGEAESRGIEPGRLFALRGHRALLATRLARPNLVKVAMAAQQALHWYGKALRLRPADADILVHLALLERNTPEKYGGGRAKALDYLRRAAGDGIWGAAAAALMRRIEGEETATPLAEAAPSVAAEAAADGPPAVEARGLRLRLPGGFELSPGDLAVGAGERVGVVGHNGSGKSVLVETLLGLRRPDAGSVSLLGAEASRLRRDPPARRPIGALLQHVFFQGRIRVRELVRMHRSIYGEQDPAAAKALGLAELEAKEYGALSRGQKQRVQLFLCLAHRPRLAVLDEPSLGLDEWFARALREHWSGPALAGRALLVVSHAPDDLAEMDRLICLRRGAVVDQGSLPELIRRHAGRFRARVPEPIPDPLRRELEALEGRVGAPLSQPSGLVLHGDEGFADRFRAWVGRHGLRAFALEPSRTEDFLSQICRNDP